VITSLENTILLLVLAQGRLDEEPVSLDDIIDEVSPDHNEIDAICAVLRLGRIGLLVEDEDYCAYWITEQGKTHLSSLIAACVMGEEDEDLGDVSDHLLREIPQLRERDCI
jgi:hypothetical protein